MKFSHLARCVALTCALSALAICPARADDGGIDTKPIPVKTPPPKYPSTMIAEGAQGLVTVKVVIDENGNVQECSVNKSTRAEFEQPAIDAIRHWKFKPATKGGVAVRSQVVIPVKFSHEA